MRGIACVPDQSSQHSIVWSLAREDIQSRLWANSVACVELKTRTVEMIVRSIKTRNMLRKTEIIRRTVCRVDGSSLGGS